MNNNLNPWIVGAAVSSFSFMLWVALSFWVTAARLWWNAAKDKDGAGPPFYIFAGAATSGLFATYAVLFLHAAGWVR